MHPGVNSHMPAFYDHSSEGQSSNGPKDALCSRFLGINKSGTNDSQGKELGAHFPGLLYLAGLAASEKEKLQEGK